MLCNLYSLKKKKKKIVKTTVCSVKRFTSKTFDYIGVLELTRTGVACQVGHSSRHDSAKLNFNLSSDRIP